MPRTIQCTKCGVVLNLPAHVSAGRRLKCPRCTTRFVVTEEDASSVSTVPGQTDAALTSFDLEKRPPSVDDLPIATSEGNLRDTFDLPLMSGRDAEQASMGGPVPVASDAAALFADSGPTRRKPTAAEARARARRCVHCGGGVPPGMSICQTCGTDQETGMRVGLEDDLAPPPPPRPAGPPLHVAIIGGICATSGIILALTGAIQSTRGTSDIEKYWWLTLALVSAFGIFACVQFMRGKSARVFMLALTMGVAVNVIGLIVYPIVRTVIIDPVDDAPTKKVETSPDDPIAPAITFKPFEDRMDSKRIVVGSAVVVLYAILSLYLMSPPVKKYIFQCRGDRSY
jgi:phage FluMu protein Com